MHFFVIVLPSVEAVHTCDLLLGYSCLNLLNCTYWWDFFAVARFLCCSRTLFPMVRTHTFPTSNHIFTFSRHMGIFLALTALQHTNVVEDRALFSILFVLYSILPSFCKGWIGFYHNMVRHRPETVSENKGDPSRTRSRDPQSLSRER